MSHIPFQAGFEAEMRFMSRLKMIVPHGVV
jgi:hypothetical protein